MVSRDPFAYCETFVREVDSDRYLSALLAPPQMRRHLFALYAFHQEIAKTAESVSQPVVGQIRLQWWRDTIEEIFARQVREHEVVRALAETIPACGLPRDLFHAMIDAREQDLDAAPFATTPAFETYAEITSGHVMRLAARILGAGSTVDNAARHVGIAYAVTGLLRALPHHARERRLMLPADLLRAAGIAEEKIFSGVASEGLNAVITQCVELARQHLNIARRASLPRRFLPALLPAAAMSLHHRKLTRANFNPFQDTAEVPVFRRQIAMMSVMLRGKI